MGTLQVAKLEIVNRSVPAEEGEHPPVPAVTQDQLRELFIAREKVRVAREEVRVIETRIAAAITAGAKVESGLHLAGFLPSGRLAVMAWRGGIMSFAGKLT